MLIAIHAVGRMKAGPEQELAARYLERLARSGPAQALEFGGVHEIPESRAQVSDERKRDEAVRLRAAFSEGSALVALDERGKTVGSQEFASRIARFRDDGRRALAFVIGGPDGLEPDLRGQADLMLAFGPMTWPHQLVRIMLAEQLYRATTILAGHPYHRA